MLLLPSTGHYVYWLLNCWTGLLACHESWTTHICANKEKSSLKCHPADHGFCEPGQSFWFVFLSQFADVPVGRQQSRWAAQWAGFPPAADLRRPFLQPVHPRAPGAGAVGLHGEAVHGRKQPRNTHPAEFQTAPYQTHRSKVRQRCHIITNILKRRRRLQ